MGTARQFVKTRYPGIYKGTAQGKPDKYKVAYRVRGLGQRTRTLDSLREARDFQAGVRNPERQEQLRKLEAGRLTLAEYLPERIERKRKLRPSTKERYRWASVHILDGRLAQLRLRDICRDDVEGWVEDLISDGVGLGAIEKALGLLRTVLACAVDEGRTLSNPARGVELPEHQPREVFVLSPEQVAEIAEDVDARFRAAIYLMGFVGLRIGEVSALQVRDLGVDAGVLHVRRNSPEVGGRKIDGTPKTKAGIRSIPIPSELAEMLADHIANWSDPESLEALMFSAPHGGALRQTAFRNRVFQPACRRLGIVRERPDGEWETPRTHDLRHAASTMLEQHGFTPTEAQAVMGHASARTTLDVYTHAIPNSMQPKMAGLGQSLTASSEQVRGDNVVPFPVAEEA